MNSNDIIVNLHFTGISKVSCVFSSNLGVNISMKKDIKRTLSDLFKIEKGINFNCLPMSYLDSHFPGNDITDILHTLCKKRVPILSEMERLEMNIESPEMIGNSRYIDILDVFNSISTEHFNNFIKLVNKSVEDSGEENNRMFIGSMKELFEMRWEESTKNMLKNLDGFKSNIKNCQTKVQIDISRIRSSLFYHPISNEGIKLEFEVPLIEEISIEDYLEGIGKMVWTELVSASIPIFKSIINDMFVSVRKSNYRSGEILRNTYQKMEYSIFEKEKGQVRPEMSGLCLETLDIFQEMLPKLEKLLEILENSEESSYYINEESSLSSNRSFLSTPGAPIHRNKILTRMTRNYLFDPIGKNSEGKILYAERITDMKEIQEQILRLNRKILILTHMKNFIPNLEVMYSQSEIKGISTLNKYINESVDNIVLFILECYKNDNNIRGSVL